MLNSKGGKMTPFNKQLGELVQKHRKQKGLTQMELAMKLGYDTPQFVSIIERGLAKIPMNTIGQLIILLDIPEKKIVQMHLDAYQTILKQEIQSGKKAVNQ